MLLFAIVPIILSVGDTCCLNFMNSSWDQSDYNSKRLSCSSLIMKQDSINERVAGELQLPMCHVSF